MPTVVTSAIRLIIKLMIATMKKSGMATLKKSGMADQAVEAMPAMPTSRRSQRTALLAKDSILSLGMTDSPGTSAGSPPVTPSSR